MELAQIDQWAVGGSSAWHHASALSKLVATALILAALVTARDWRVILTGYAILVAIIWLARLPVLKVALIGAYPAVFTIFFAVSQRGGIELALLIFSRSIAAAMAMLLLITTTPFVDVFAALGRLLPSLLADGLLVTYRSFFILLETYGRLLQSIRLRGGYSRWSWQGFNQIAEIIGVTFLHALALAEHSHAALHLRGYAGRIPSSDRWRRINAFDVLPLTLGAVMLTAALIIR